MLSQKIKMRLRSYNCRVLERAVRDVMDTAQSTGAVVKGPIPFPVSISRFVVLRSPHIDKKARDTFECRKYSRLLEIECTPTTLEALKGLTMASEVDVEIRV